MNAAPELPDTNASGEMLWDVSLRRWAVAFDIGGLFSFEAAHL